MKAGDPRLGGPVMRLGLAAMLLASLGAALGLPHAPGGPTLAFVVASVAALGTRAGVALAALALCAGLATAPVPQPTLALSAFGTALAGLGLGLLGRELDRLHRVITSPYLLAALVAVLAAATLALPDGLAHLADGAGAPLTLPATVIDGTTFMRRVLELPVMLPLASPAHGLDLIAATFVLIALVLLAIVHLRGSEAPSSIRRGTWELTLLAAGLGTLAGLLGLLQGAGLFGDVALDAEATRHTFDLALSRDGSVLEVAASGQVAQWRPWSRPWVDGLRFITFVTLLVLALRRLRRPELEPTKIALGLTPLAPIGLALTALGAALLAATNGLQGAPLALVAGVVLGLGALVAGRFGARAPGAAWPLSPLFALGASGVLWIYAWLVTPLFGA